MKPEMNHANHSNLVAIEKPIYGGSFLAHVEGKAVFVPLTLPGEQLRIRITQSKSAYASAEVEEIVAAAPERTAPPCPHFGTCGGCHYQHTDYTTQLKLKQSILRETLERGGVTVPRDISVLSGKPLSYRNRIRLAFDASGKPGYRSRRSHFVVPVTECPIAAPLLMEAAQAIAEIARKVVPPLRPTELALFCDAAESSFFVSISVAKAKKIRFDEFAELLHAQIPALLGAELLLKSKDSQPPRTVAHWGAASLSYHAAGFDYRVDHGAFFQVNRWLVDALVVSVTAGHSGALAWDLFAGVGLFSRRLTASFKRVIAVESAPCSTKALAANLKGTVGIPVRAATHDFLRRDHQEQRPDLVVPDLIIVDPPRSGLGAETCALLGAVGTPALVYVSCDPATLTRDLKTLVNTGYSIQSITLADLFPQTFHLETVVQLRRS